MTALNKQALREMAERAGSDSWGYDRDEFNDAITPEVVLALLDEMEAKSQRFAELELRLSQQQSIAANNLDMFRRADA
ncbi:TPA: ead/Ea22-like family protein, partial [Citrobacter freundii]